MVAITAAATPFERLVPPTPLGLTDDEWFRIWKPLPHDNIACLPITVSAVAIVVSLVAVGLRLYTRHSLLNNIGFDDVCTVLSLFGVTALAAATIAQTGHGLGTHGWDLEGWTSAVMYLKVIIYYTTLLLIKLSISWQYYRMVKQDNRYRLPYIVVIYVVMGWSIASIFVMIFSCYPVEGFWLKNPETYNCDFSRGYIIATGNIVTDFILVLLPMPMVFRLNIKTSRKWALLGLFAIGSFACIVSILRVIYLPKDFDVTYAGAHAASWTLAEVAAGILGVSMMTLQPLVKRFGAWLELTHSFCRRSSDGTEDQVTYNATLRERLGTRTNDDVSKSPIKTATVRASEGSETELTRIDDADETGTMRKVETQSHVGSMPTSSTSTPLHPNYGGEQRPSRTDLAPCGLAVLVQTQCRAGPGGDDTPSATAAAKGSETKNRRSGQVGIQIKWAWSVQEYRHDEGP